MNFISRFQASRALSRADKLAQKGQLADAIQLLSKQVRHSENPDLERAIIDMLLQNRADPEPARTADVSTGEADAPARQFKDGEIPEIDAADLNAPLLRQAIDQAGYLIVRGFFDQQDSKELRHCIDQSLNARVDREDATQASEPENAWYYPSPHFPGTHIAFSNMQKDKAYARTGSIMVADSPRGSFRVLEIYRKHGLRKLLDAYFREPAVLATRKWVFRLVTPRQVGTGVGGGWHQDGQFMGEDIRALNLWVALSECGDGTDAPGMALLPQRVTKILETGTRDANIPWVVPGALVKELAEETPIVRPRFAAGDALFFDHYSLHRSGHAVGQTANRYALESWFYANTAIADNAVIDLV